MTQDRPEQPPPLEANDQLVTAAGTAAWALALIVVALVPGIPRWWIWTCATGFGMGLFGLWYVPRLKESRTRRAAADQSVRPAG
jgi:Protein of unknown function (DUF2530)